MRTILTSILAVALLSACAPPPPLLISVISTNDVHGQLLPKQSADPEQISPAGLASLSAYVDALRQARALDDGAVLLIDAGDMWQGTLESNLSEGASVVSAYNALGYTAATVGNHELDFGPAGPAPIPEADGDDARGALKQRALEANFPFLAANLIDENTGKPVRWKNVNPSVTVDVKGVQVGIIGVMTEHALAASIAANTKGLSLAPLAETIEKEARSLREAGATIIIVTAHAGGACTDFSDPRDTSSCGLDHEIFTVANALPQGLVDHIIAGHEHQGIAHFVNEIAITSSFSRTMAFGRVDLSVDRKSGNVLSTTIHPPTPLKGGAQYEGILLQPNPDVALIVANAAATASQYKDKLIGITLTTPFDLENNPESSLGNLFVDSMLDTIDADISVHVNSGGIRANLPAGALTFGSVYEMMPFDNTLVIIELSGAQLRHVISEQAHHSGRRVGFSGMRVDVSCVDKLMAVKMQLADGNAIDDSDTIRIAVANFVALGGNRVLSSVTPENGFEMRTDAPLVRDVIIRSLRKRGGSISADDFLSGDKPRWTIPEAMDPACSLRN